MYLYAPEGPDVTASPTPEMPGLEAAGYGALHGLVGLIPGLGHAVDEAADPNSASNIGPPTGMHLDQRGMATVLEPDSPAVQQQMSQPLSAEDYKTSQWAVAGGWHPGMTGYQAQVAQEKAAMLDVQQHTAQAFAQHPVLAAAGDVGAQAVQPLNYLPVLDFLKIGALGKDIYDLGAIGEHAVQGVAYAGGYSAAQEGVEQLKHHDGSATQILISMAGGTLFGGAMGAWAKAAGVPYQTRVAALGKSLDQMAAGDPVDISGTIHRDVSRGEELAAPAALGPESAGEVGKRFSQRADTDMSAMVAEYRRRFGNNVSADDAKMLSPEYAAGIEGRSRYAAAVHDTSSRVSKAAYQEMLAEKTPEGKVPEVMFTAGGTGAGKTSGVSTDGNPEIVYDTNLAHYGTAVSKIDQARASGRAVIIKYAHADALEAWKRVLSRAEKHGRAVPMDVHLGTHQGALDTIRRVAAHYKDDKGVTIQVMDNSGPKGAGKVIPLDNLPAKVDNHLHEKLSQYLEDSAHAGRITQRVLDTARSESRPETLERTGPHLSQNPESERPGGYSDKLTAANFAPIGPKFPEKADLPPAFTPEKPLTEQETLPQTEPHTFSEGNQDILDGELTAAKHDQDLADAYQKALECRASG